MWSWNLHWVYSLINKIGQWLHRLGHVTFSEKVSWSVHSTISYVQNSTSCLVWRFTFQERSWCIQIFLHADKDTRKKTTATNTLFVYGHVVSRSSRSAVRMNRIMKLYFVYDWSVVWSCDLDHVKTKQETPFPILKERTRGGKTVLALLGYLYGFLWCFDIKVLYVKLLTRLQIV